MLDFGKLQTPPGDGDVLIEPPLAAWPELISQNVRSRRAYNFTLAGEPAATAIREARAVLIEGPVIAGGHQPAFVHPGVWAKRAAIGRAARTMGVDGLDFVVDNDAPQSSVLTVPVISPDGLVSRCEVAFSPVPVGSAYEGRPALNGRQIETIRRKLSALLGERFASSLLPQYLDGLAGATDARDYVDQHLAARLTIDQTLQADLAEARVSKAFGGLFLADLLLNPDPFAVAYNQALADYRQQRHIRGSERPLPDLGREADRTETALWVYQPLQRRQRLWVRRADDRVELLADDNLVGLVSARDLAHQPDLTLAALRPWVVRPRALTLTLWARLLACDLFVHGIGGAKYDLITDEIIRRYYRCPPPAYACVSATLRLPLPVFEATPQTLLIARHQLRDWQFNPDRYLQNAPAEVIEERHRLIARSNHLRQTRGPRMARADVFRAIREVTARLAELEPSRGVELLAGIAKLEAELGSNAVARSREFFYMLQPRERLADLAGRIA